MYYGTKCQRRKITRETGIEPVVFYYRSKNLNDCYEQLIKRYDYWLTDFMKQQGDTIIEASAENCAKILDGLVSALCNDKIML